MALSDLYDDEVKVIGECLRAVATGPFFKDCDDAEFHALFGLTRSALTVVVSRFPDVDEFDDDEEGNDDSWLAINNALVYLLRYPHDQGEKWSEYISVSPFEVERIFGKWRAGPT